MDESLKKIIIYRITRVIDSESAALMEKRGRLLNDAASRGFPLIPGEAQNQINKLSENLHSNLPLLIIQEMRDVLLIAKPKPSPELAMGLKNLLSSYTRSPERFFSEIDLIMNELENHERGDQMISKAHTTNVHINAPGGIVQTGNHSTANLMVLNQNQQNDIITALNKLKLAINNVAEIQDDSKEDVIGLIEETKSEISKTQPNKTRLKSFLTGIASGIQTCASLKPTYDALKTVLLPIGISLP